MKDKKESNSGYRSSLIAAGIIAGSALAGCNDGHHQNQTANAAGAQAISSLNRKAPNLEYYINGNFYEVANDAHHNIGTVFLDDGKLYSLSFGLDGKNDLKDCYMTITRAGKGNAIDTLAKGYINLQDSKLSPITNYIAKDKWITLLKQYLRNESMNESMNSALTKYVAVLQEQQQNDALLESQGVTEEIQNQFYDQIPAQESPLQDTQEGKPLWERACDWVLNLNAAGNYKK